MGDEAKTFEFVLKTTAEGSGAAQTAEDLAKVKEGAAGATPVIRDYATEVQKAAVSEEEFAAAIAKSREAQGLGKGGGARNDESIQEVREAMAKASEEEAAAAAKIAAAEERRNALVSQRQAIIELELEALQAEGAQELAKAAGIEREIVIRREALRIQQQTVITEEAAMVMAEQRVVAVEQIAAAERQQVALDAEKIAAEEAVLAIERKQTLEKEKQAAAQATFTRSIIATAGSKVGLSGLAGGLAGGVGGLLAVAGLDVAFRLIGKLLDDAGKKSEEFGEKAGKTRDIVDSYGRVIERIPAKMDAFDQQALESKKALDELAEKFKTAADEAERLRQAQDALADVKLSLDLAKVDLAESRDQISHGDAAEKRATLRRDAQVAKLDRDDDTERTKARVAGGQAGDTELKIQRAQEELASAQSAQAEATKREQAAREKRLAIEEIEADETRKNGGASMGTIEDIRRAKQEEERALDDSTKAAQRRNEAVDAVENATKENAAAEKNLAKVNRDATEKIARNAVEKERLGVEKKTEGQEKENRETKRFIDDTQKDAVAEMNTADAMAALRKKNESAANAEKQRAVQAEIDQQTKGADKDDVGEFRDRMRKAADLRKKKIDLKREQDRRENKELEAQDYDNQKAAVDQETRKQIDDAEEAHAKKADAERAKAREQRKKEFEEKRSEYAKRHPSSPRAKESFEDYEKRQAEKNDEHEDVQRKNARPDSRTNESEWKDRFKVRGEPTRGREWEKTSSRPKGAADAGGAGAGEGGGELAQAADTQNAAADAIKETGGKFLAAAQTTAQAAQAINSGADTVDANMRAFLATGQGLANNQRSLQTQINSLRAQVESMGDMG